MEQDIKESRVIEKAAVLLTGSVIVSAQSREAPPYNDQSPILTNPLEVRSPLTL